MGQPDTPDAPDLAREYERGIEVYLRHLPELLAAEQNARSQYDPERVRQQQALQDEFGPTQARQQLDALRTLDPEGYAIRGQLASSVSNDLAAGYRLPEQYDTELTSNIRGAQAARGNSLGTGAASAEAAFKGKAALDLYQQHLQNAGNFLGGPTPMGQIAQIQGVSPDRSSAYTNPGAGYAGVNMGQQNFENMLAQQKLAQGQGGGWGGAARGAAEGAYYGSGGGTWGAIGGGIIGGAAGYFSSRTVKTDIVEVGTSPRGFGIVEFSYIGDPAMQRFRGVIAEDVQKIMPEAVFKRGDTLAVKYDMLDVPLERVI